MKEHYSYKLAHNIKLMNLYMWQQYYVHLTYADMHKLFYKYESTVTMGDLLITTPFNNNYELLKKFNETYKKNNYQIKDPFIEIKPLFDNYIAPLYNDILDTKWKNLQ